MTKRFNKAYNALTTAFFEGTLAKGTCVACACGNIILDALGIPLTKEQFHGEILRITEGQSIEVYKETLAFNDFVTNLWANRRAPNCGSFEAYENYKDEINAAGFSAEEFAKIEIAFEKNTNISFSSYCKREEKDILEDQYNGLCAVVDVLMELDSVKEGADELKGKFRTHPKLVTC